MQYSRLCNIWRKLHVPHTIYKALYRKIQCEHTFFISTFITIYFLSVKLLLIQTVQNIMPFKTLQKYPNQTLQSFNQLHVFEESCCVPHSTILHWKGKTEFHQKWRIRLLLHWHGDVTSLQECWWNEALNKYSLPNFEIQCTCFTAIPYNTRTSWVACLKVTRLKYTIYRVWHHV